MSLPPKTFAGQVKTGHWIFVKSSPKFKSIPQSSPNSNEVAKSGEKFPKVPRRGEKFPKVPQSSPSWRKVPHGGETWREMFTFRILTNLSNCYYHAPGFMSDSYVLVPEK
jgi:hypothetical protein